MIKVTKLNNTITYINPHLLEAIEEHPDTTLTYNGQKLIVKDAVADIIARIVSYRRSIGIAISDKEKA